MKKISIATIALILSLTMISCTTARNPENSDTETQIKSKTTRSTTYLVEEMGKFEDTKDKQCTKSYYELTGESESSIEEKLDSKIFKDEITKILGEQNKTQSIIEDAKDLIGKYKESKEDTEIAGLSSVCKTQKNIYAVLSTYSPTPRIAKWSEEEGFEISDEMFSGGIKIDFFPEVLNGKSLFYAKDGDTVASRWVFYSIDPETMQSELIEKCTMEFAYDEESHTRIEEEFELNCEIEHTESNWILESGTPPYADPDPLVYNGEEVLKGWVIYRPFYVGEDVPHFFLAEEDREKLPEGLQDKSAFILKNYNEGTYKDIDPAIITELETYTESSPAQIRINRIQVNMEGSPFMGFIEILNK